MSFQNIPSEMRAFRQWVVWRLEIKENGKDTKVPYNINTFRKASVTNPSDWSDFASVIVGPFGCTQAVSPSTPISVSGFSGIGFVFTTNDPFTGIDLDDTHGVAEDYERQVTIFNDFDSYSEISQSGRGLHIIVKGNVSHGRRRANIEVYSSERYFAITGNVHAGKFVINDRQDVLTRLWEQMGGEANLYTFEGDGEQKSSDEEIIEQASKALNGEKFLKLWNGDFNDYPSQSEADFALVDIIAFYTQNREQIRRLFRLSSLGQTPKDNYAHRGDRRAYVEYMVRKSFDRQLPPIDIEALKIKLDDVIKQPVPVYEFTEAKPLAEFPPGLVGEVAQYIYDNAPTPIPEIAMAGALGLVSGITGRAFNVSGTGLNQYILLLAPTGSGKEAMASGIANIMNKVCASVPASIEFRGPGQLVSEAGLIRAFEKTPALFSIIGEFGLMLKNMCNDRHHMHGVQRVLLHLFNKSGKGNIFDGTAYSDKTKNIPSIVAPAFTLLGESVPSSFYSSLDENMIRSGLLPRFLIIEYKGKVPYYRATNIQPPFYLVEKLQSLCAIALQRQSQNQVQDVMLSPSAKQAMDDFSRECTDKNNNSESEITKELWSRSHIKALKLAAVISVGIEPINPIIEEYCAKWCIEFISEQNLNLISQFDDGNVGSGNNESDQFKDICKAIYEFSTLKIDHAKKYLVPQEMHMAGVIPHSSIIRRLTNIKSFREDRIGATNAIKKQIQNLLEADDIKELSRSQMLERFKTTAKAYIVSNPDRFKPGK